MAHDFPQNDGLRRLRKTQATAAAAYCFYISGYTQLICDLHEVVFRDTIALCNLGNRRETIFLKCEIH